MKKLLFVLGALVFAVVALIVVSRFMVKGSMEEKISKLIGLPTKIDSLETGYFIKIKGLKIKNPEGFSNDTMIDISSVNIDKNLGEMEVRVKKLLVEKSPTGRLNLDYLSPSEENLGDIKIKKLKVHLDKVSYKDPEGKIKDYQADLHKEYENLPNPGSAIDIIVSEGPESTDLPEDEGINPPDPDEDLPPGEDIPPDGGDDNGDGDDDNGDGDDGDGEEPPKPGWGGGWYQ